MSRDSSVRTETPQDGVGSARFRWIMGGLMSIMLLSALDHTIVVTALPLIVADLGSPDALSAVVTGYMLASALSALWFGQIADYLGRRTTLLACVIGFIAASAACGLAQTLPQLIVLRIAQGIAAGGLLTLSQTIIADLVPPRERARYQSYILSVFGGASVAGPFLGGLLADQLSWRAIFLINVPVGIVALGILYRSLSDQFGVLGRPTSLVSSITLGVAAVLILLGISRVGEGQSLAAAAGLAALGTTALVAFIAVERRVRHPLFAAKSIRSRLYITSSISGFAVHAAMMGAVVLMPLYLQGVLGMSAAETGLAMLPQIGAWLAATLLCGVLDQPHRQGQSLRVRRSCAERGGSALPGPAWSRIGLGCDRSFPCRLRPGPRPGPAVADRRRPGRGQRRGDGSSDGTLLVLTIGGGRPRRCTVRSRVGRSPGRPDVGALTATDSVGIGPGSGARTCVRGSHAGGSFRREYPASAVTSLIVNVCCGAKARPRRLCGIGERSLQPSCNKVDEQPADLGGNRPSVVSREGLDLATKSHQ